MLFNSLQYLIYLPIVVGGYYLCPHRWRWLLLLIASYYFYMCWKAEYAILLLFSTGVAYAAGLGIAGTDDVRRRKTFLWSSLTVLLGILFTFKYYNFVGETLRTVLAKFSVPITLPYSDLLLPIGISFYTFQKISYIVDVYKGQSKVERHFGVFAVYSCFFPQLVAGPIERLFMPIRTATPGCRCWWRRSFSHSRSTVIFLATPTLPLVRRSCSAST